MTYRFLLDQNFPNPRFDPATVDTRVTYVPVRDFDGRLIERGTPDWLIILRAAEEQFDGVVSRDASQLETPESLVAAMSTDLSVITWRDAIEDPIQEWGQMMAYMPLVLDRVEREGPAIFYLPKPRIDARNVARASGLVGEYATQQHRANQEVRAEARAIMVDELERRGLDHLVGMLPNRRAAR